LAYFNKHGGSDDVSYHANENDDDLIDLKPFFPETPFSVTAIAEYTAVDSTQMSITKGERYSVVRVDEGGHWFQAKSGSKLLWFPASYARVEQ